MIGITWNYRKYLEFLTIPGKRAEGDLPCVQQGRRGLYLRGGAQIRYDSPSREGDDDDADGNDDDDDDEDDFYF